jgi:hypothetical protein
VAFPERHWLAHDAVIDPEVTQIGGKRDSERPGADDQHVCGYGSGHPGDDAAYTVQLKRIAPSSPYVLSGTTLGQWVSLKQGFDKLSPSGL